MNEELKDDQDLSRLDNEGKKQSSIGNSMIKGTEAQNDAVWSKWGSMALEDGSVNESEKWQEKSLIIMESQEKLEFCFADKKRESK